MTGYINVINKAKDLNAPIPIAPALVSREGMPGYYQLYQTYFELNDVTADKDFEYIHANSNELGGTITLFDNNENSIQKVSGLFKSMVNRYPSNYKD